MKAATASSRVETLPKFVRSRPSRTRAAFALVVAYLSRAGIVEADGFGRTRGILAVTAVEGDILGA